MNLGPEGNSDSRPELARPKLKGGSVQRARQMLEAGKRPKLPPQEPREDSLEAPAVSSKASHITQWPLPDNSAFPGVFLDPQASHVPRGPPPPRPPRPDMPSPSIYSERSAPGVAPSPLKLRPRFPSFSQPLPQNSNRFSTRETSPESRSNAEAGLAPQISVTNEDLSRQSAASDTVSVPSIPDFPLPANRNAVPINQQSNRANLAPPPPPPPPLLSNSVRDALKRRSSISPIPEELSDNTTNLEGSYASSKAVPSSWGSASPGAEVLGTYLDVESDDDQETEKSTKGNGDGIVRQASLGKRGKPSLRIIQKPNANSPAPPESQRSNSEAGTIPRSIPGVGLSGNTGGRNGGLKVSSPTDSLPSLSDRSYEFDLEKGAFVLDIDQTHPACRQVRNGGGNPGNTSEDLRGAAAPTMSDKRPGARRPPRLDMDAVRDAEARGSLTSLSDLIRRATRLATNLDHGRTASRNDVLNASNDPRLPPYHQRNSGTMQDALTSFPPPPRPTEARSSWPAFIRRSTFHNIDSQGSYPDDRKEKQNDCSRKCCGMPLWLFILICVAILLVIALAVLLPMFLIVVPRQKASELSACEKSNPCKNGGISVSSGPTCSCVCTNGYTGSQCTLTGDDSCTTTDVEGTSKSATIGSDLPQLLETSQKTFSITLDPVTIVALFSESDVSCAAQNKLVSFENIPSNNARRSFPVVQQAEEFSLEKPSPAPTSSLEKPKRGLAQRAVASINGIVFDNSSPSEDSSTATTTAAAEDTKSSSEQETSTSTPTATGTTTSVPQKAIDFSRIAVLYILEMTGELNAAMVSEEDVQFYLNGTYQTSGPGNHSVDLSDSNVKTSFALDFASYIITVSNGTVVGGN